VFGALDRNGDGKIDSLEWTLGSFMTVALNNSLVAASFADGDKPAPPKVVWRERKSLPEVASPLCYQGRVYLAKHDGIVSCLDAKTGKLLDRKRLPGAAGLIYASPVAGDGKVYLATMRGAVLVLKAADKLEVLARNDLGEPVAATPALVGGVLYLRAGNHLYAYRE
jgi:outer membrane protein assembly factor BamB